MFGGDGGDGGDGDVGGDWFELAMVGRSGTTVQSLTDHLCDEDADDPNVDEQFGHPGARSQRT